MKRYLLILSSFFCLLGLSIAQAEQLAGLYSASVPIPTQQNKERGAGFEAALDEVLVKVSGKLATLDYLTSVGANISSQSLVQTFSYRENPEHKQYLEDMEAKRRQVEALQQALIEEGSDPLGQTDPDLPEREEGSLDEQIRVLEEKLARSQNPLFTEDEYPTDLEEEAEIEQVIPMPYLLDVSFSETGINKLLTRYNVPIWGKTRPSSIFWMVFEQGGERRLIGEDDFEDKQFLQNLAFKRGLSVFLPVADLLDISLIDTGDLWALFPGAVNDASLRYDADVIVMLRAYQSAEGLWETAWHVEHRNASTSGTLSTDQIQGTLDQVVDSLANMLANRYAVLRGTGESSEDFAIKVSNIKDFSDYIRVQAYLEGLPPVAQVKLKSVNQAEHHYELVLSGTEEQFFEHIELDRKLKRSEKSEVIEKAAYTIDLNVENDATEAIDNPYIEFETQLTSNVINLIWQDIEG